MLSGPECVPKVSALLTQLNCLPEALVPGHIHIIRKGHCASCLVNKITSRWQILAPAEPDLPQIPLSIKRQQGCLGSLRWFLIMSFTCQPKWGKSITMSHTFGWRCEAEGAENLPNSNETATTTKKECIRFAVEFRNLTAVFKRRDK